MPVYLSQLAMNAGPGPGTDLFIHTVPHKLARDQLARGFNARVQQVVHSLVHGSAP